MKISLFKFIFLSTLVLFLGISCTNDVVDPGMKNGVAVRISADVGGLQAPGAGNFQGSTRAANNVWDEGDVIGVTMVSPQSHNVVSPYRNFGYKTSGDGSFAPNDASQIIYFPTSDEEVTFRSYYPYNKDLSPNLLIPISTANQANLANIDLMTADHLSGTSTADPNVKLHFYHRLAKVVVNLTTDNESISILDGVQLTMSSQKTEADYDLLNERLIIENNLPDATVNIPVRNAKAEAIVLPRPAGEGVVFEITTTDGGKYIATMSSDLELKAGYVHTFHIRLKSPAEISATIEPWVEGPERHYDAVRLVTGLGITEGFDTGHELDLFLKEGEDSEFGLLEKFTLDGSNTWVPRAPIYWESLTGSPTVFRGATVYETALNDTQMDDILISKDIDVDPFTGVNLELEHAGSKLNIVLQSSDGTYTNADLEKAIVLLPNYLNSGSYNDKGEFVPGDTRGNISLEDGVAIFPPQLIENGDNILTVNIDGHIYEVKAEKAEGFDYEKGHEYTFVVDARKAKVELSTTVKPWIEETYEFEEVRVGTANLDNNGGDLIDGDELFLFSGDDTERISLPGKFVYDEATDTWTYEGSTAPLYWEDIPSEGNLYSSITRPAIDATEGNNQSADYITATPIANKGGTDNTALNFKLTHQVAKVNVMLRSETHSGANLQSASVTLPDYAIGGRLDKGVYVPGIEKGPIQLAKPIKAGEDPNITYNTSSYLQPQTIEIGEELVVVKIDGHTYTVKPEDVKNVDPADIKYEAGKVTNLIITIEKSGVSMSVEVTPWIELPALEFGVIHLVTGLGVTEGFDVGHELDLFLKGNSDSDFSKYEKFEYEGNNIWTPESPVYWEDLKDLPVTFRGATIYEDALNSTQMADILISKDVVVDPFTGVNLVLDHVGSKVNIVLQSSDGTYTNSDLNGATIILPDYLNSGSYNDKGEFVPGTSRGDISPQDGVAIFPPQTIGNGENLIEVILDGRLYEIKVEETAGFEYKGGHEYTLVVDAVKAKVEVSTVITPWVEETFEYSEVRVGPTMLDDNEGDLVDDDELYLFAGDNNNRTSLPGRFVYDEATDTWTYEGSSAPLYWENITDEGNLYASITRPAVNTTTGNNQSADYITATPIVNNGGTDNTALNFKMTHKVAKVNVMLRSTTYEESKLLNANVTLPGYAIGGKLDKGVYVPGTEVGPILLGKPVKTGEAPNYLYNTSSYLQPQTIGLSQDLVTVEIEGRTYTIKPNQLKGGNALPVAYEAGKITNLIITIEKTGLSVSVEVTPWDELPSLEFEALFFSVTNKESSGFENNDQIKFYKLNASGNAVEGSTNVYKYAGGPDYGTLSPVGTPWYRDDFKTGDLISAVYPNNAQEVATGQRTFSWQAKSEGVTNAHADDVMVAVPVEGHNWGEIQSNGNVEFEFRHVLSKVTINLIVGEGFTPAEITPATVEMNNFRLSGTVDVIDGKATPSGSATAAFNPTKLGTPNAVTGKTVVSSFEAFIMPQTITNGTVVITVKLGDGVFEAKLPAEKVFAGGAHNMFNLTLNKTGAILSASIVDWNHEGPIDLELH